MLETCSTCGTQFLPTPGKGCPKCGSATTTEEDWGAIDDGWDHSGDHGKPAAPSTPPAAPPKPLEAKLAPKPLEAIAPKPLEAKPSPKPLEAKPAVEAKLAPEAHFAADPKPAVEAKLAPDPPVKPVEAKPVAKPVADPPVQPQPASEPETGERTALEELEAEGEGDELDVPTAQVKRGKRRVRGKKSGRPVPSSSPPTPSAPRAKQRRAPQSSDSARIVPKKRVYPAWLLPLLVFIAAVVLVGLAIVASRGKH